MRILAQLQTSLRAKMQVQKRVAEELRKRSAQLTEVRVRIRVQYITETPAS